jgi:hypothetical protein
VIDGLHSVLRGWGATVSSAMERGRRAGGTRRDLAKRNKAPLIRVTRTRRGYRRVSVWTRVPSLIRERTRGSVTSAVCGVHFELIDWYATEHPNELCLHAAGLRFPRGLVVFPALAKAGKSVLTVALAARGVRVYADDVVPINLSTRRAVSLGILPRLRPPLPATASRGFRDYVEAHGGLGRGDRLYVEVPDTEMVPFGETTPVRGIVLLERSARGAASIETVDRADALETLILQNFAQAPPADRVLDTLHRVVAGAECRRLRYVRSEDAASLLLATFGDPGKARARRSSPERRP